MNTSPEAFQSLPAIGKLLETPEVKALIPRFGKELITFSARHAVEKFRTELKKGIPPPSIPEITAEIKRLAQLFSNRSLKKVINATGIIIHTNLGRAPFGKTLLADSFKVLENYNNLEFDLERGERGDRNVHATALLRFLTEAEDILIVNNNAAAVMLILRAFARGREVIVSRGELIEIGGSFRLPEIMAASDCRMVEVGTTNKTRLNDYEQAINENTAMLLKVHRSNYVIKGFTEEAELEELVKTGRKYNIPVLFDLGSGLLHKNGTELFSDEPDVKNALRTGCDLVCFSGDKLLGGPQAGIIAGKKAFVEKLKKEPMLRALRVCKLTLALLETVCLYYLRKETLTEKSFMHKILSSHPSEIHQRAKRLGDLLEKSGIRSGIEPGRGQCGGGTLPDKFIDSYSVILKYQGSNKIRAGFAEKIYAALLNHEQPVVAILKKGELVFDMLTVSDEEVNELAEIISEVYHNMKSGTP